MGTLNFFKTQEQTDKAMSPLKDPFSVDCIENIHIWIRNHEAYGKPVMVRVEFINGNTKGEQKFTGENLAAVMTEVQAFIDSLKK